MGFKPRGDHSSPKSMLGDKALSKKVQKIEKKNMNSLKINNIKENFNDSIK